MTPVTALAGIATVFAALFIVGLVRTPPDPVALLTSEYLRLMHLGPELGREHLAERLKGLEQRFPGRSHGWRLRWLVDDLRRAKR
jgi:hypothetical protein